MEIPLPTNIKHIIDKYSDKIKIEEDIKKLLNGNMEKYNFFREHNAKLESE
tara:strand:+ start:316 stop:468 length:153 start_codon:yes stop_codon:yes gene_type:complete